MDRDLRDAVLAAFDDDSDDDGSKTSPEAGAKKGAAEADDDSAGDIPEDQQTGKEDKTDKNGAARSSQKAMMAKAAMTSRMKAAGSRRGSRPQEGTAEEGAESASGKAARVAAPVVRSRSGRTDREGSSGGSSKLLFLCLGLNLLTILLIVLVMNHLSSQVDELRGTLEQRLDGIQEGVLDTREMAKFARIKFGTYVEPGKRPQSVIVVVEEKAGRLVMGKTVIRPLEEE